MRKRPLFGERTSFDDAMLTTAGITLFATGTNPFRNET